MDSSSKISTLLSFRSEILKLVSLNLFANISTVHFLRSLPRSVYEEMDWKYAVGLWVLSKTR
jgi:hypothetical protein